MRALRLLLALGCLLAIPAVPAAAAPERATTTPIEHVVMVMQDNHSFDNYFGTYPGADGLPSGVCQRLSLNRESSRGCIQPFHLGDTPAEDLGQSLGIQRRQYDDGKMDGFVAAYRRLGQDGSSAMGYYDGRDIPFHWNVAAQNVLFDRFFASTPVGSRESYLYWLAGRTPAGPQPLQDHAGYDGLRTVFDRLAARDVSAKFYVENLDPTATGPRWADNPRPSQLIKVPLLSMSRFRDGGALAGRVVDLSQYYTDVRNGTLPAVSYVVTSGSSENPPASPAAGQKVLRSMTSELMRSRYWSTSAFMWTYDGWGGWYDHVAPPTIGSDRLGFRVPALLLSPYARRGVVDHTVLDYTSMLAFVESNWRLAPLATRDRDSAGLASAFDFAAPPRPAELPALTWPAPEPSDAANHPAPVIYGLYGTAVASGVLVFGLVLFTHQPFRLRLPVPAFDDAVAALVWGREPDPLPRRARLDGGAAALSRRPSVFVDGGQTWAEWHRTLTRPEGTSPAEPRRARPTTGPVASVRVEGGQSWADWYAEHHPLQHPRVPRRGGDGA